MKKLILFILTFYVENSYSCKVDDAGASTIEDNPTTAGLIVVGYVDQYFKDTYLLNNLIVEKNNLIVEKKWTESLPEIKIFGSLIDHCNAPTVRNKEKYLLLNKNSVVSGYQNSIGIQGNESVFVKLSDAESYIDKLSSITSIPNNQSNPSWEYCKEDQQCVETKNICGDSVSVNTKYKTKYDQYVSHFKGKKKCDNSKVLTNNAKLKCIDYFCGYKK